jgi:uncharacterized protein
MITSNFSSAEKKILLEVATKSIQHGLSKGRALSVILTDYPVHLQESGACFVTLEMNGELRGCIGSLEAHQPLIVDVAKNAYAAAFQDPRFPPLTEAEYPRISKHISVLSKATPIDFKSEGELLTLIRPSIDGLILVERGARGTFLPSVWESLPDPKEFLRHLKLKAGLAPNYWSDTIRVFRYTAEMVEE